MLDTTKSLGGKVLGPRWFSVATWLGAFLLSGQTLAFGQRSFLTADQVIAKYQEAIGGSDRFSSVMTFVEKGDVTGNLTDFVPAFHSPPLGNSKVSSNSTSSRRTVGSACCASRIK